MSEVLILRKIHITLLKMKNKIKISADGVEIPCVIYEAKTFYEKFAGLMFCRQKYGLMIKNCSSVHTCFMKFKIDIVCLDKDYKIVKVFYGIKPFRAVFQFNKTRHILELPSGCYGSFSLKKQQTIMFC